MDSINNDRIHLLNMVYGGLEQLYMYFYINKNKDIIIDYRTGDIVLDFRNIPNRNYAINRRETFFLVKRNIIVAKDDANKQTIFYNKSCEKILIAQKAIWTTDVKEYIIRSGSRSIIGIPLGSNRNKITTALIVSTRTGEIETIHRNILSLHFKDCDNVMVSCIEDGEVKYYFYRI
ncbi:MAG: hypothetical protein J6A59_01705 [Lachnospiraceae bacterium]|nr:hypothetical protein [Lachnospiraceae bacterium]